jgi:hypothetical protein
MKKLIVVFLFLAAPAWADWVLVYDMNEASFYIDPASVRKEGRRLKVTGLQDLKVRDVDGAASRRAQAEYDCANARYRLLSLTVYPEPMGRGKILWSMDANPDGWVPLPPGTGVEVFVGMACTQ